MIKIQVDPIKEITFQKLFTPLCIFIPISLQIMMLNDNNNDENDLPRNNANDNDNDENNLPGKGVFYADVGDDKVKDI